MSRRAIIAGVAGGGLVLAVVAGVVLLPRSVHRPAAVCQTVSARIVSLPAPLEDTVREAAAIWRGTVVAIAEGSEYETLQGDHGEAWQGRRNVARFEVDRVLKGVPVSGTRTVTYWVTPDGPYLPLVGVDQHGLVFVNGQGQVVDKRRPVLWLGPGGESGPPDARPLQAVKGEMIFSLRDGVDPWIVSNLVFELVHRMHTDFGAVAPALRELAASSDDRIASWGLWALAMYEDRDGVSALVDVACAHAGDPHHPIRNAVNAVGYVHDPSLASVVEPLLDTQVVAFRYAALRALRNMHSRDYVGRLIQALDDEDRHNQFVAIRALGEILDKHPPDWTTNSSGFAKDPDKYIAKWKAWWESEGRAEYGKK